MAYLGNLLNTGECVAPVPLGLRAILEYNAKGHLVAIKMNGGAIDITKQVLKPLLQNKLIPNILRIFQGDTRVYGVFYTKHIFNARGPLPDALEDSILTYLQTNPEDFTFFANYANSTVSKFHGSASTRMWLMSNAFTSLPNFIVPINMTQQQYQGMFSSFKVPFRPNEVVGFQVFNNDDSTYRTCHLRQFVVHHVTNTIDDAGHFVSTVCSSYNRDIVKLNLSEVVKHNIQKNACVTLTDKNDIVSVIYDVRLAPKEALPNDIPCPVCGKKIHIPSTGFVTCSDRDCVSRLYNDVQHLVKALNLPDCTRELYDQNIQFIGTDFTPDMILDDDTYADTSIAATVPQILFAGTPIDVVANISFFQQMYEACKSSLPTVKYYLTHPEKISQDLSINSVFLPQFLKWVKETPHLAMLQRLLDHDNITITTRTRNRTNSAPILRGKRILLTGKFAHGTTADVTDMLSSWAATVVTGFDKDITDLVVGGLNEGTNAHLIRQCQSAGISVSDEQTFFTHYELDKELVENL